MRLSRRMLLPTVAVLGLTAGNAAFAQFPQPRFTGQVPGYSPDVANEEAYWYSRYSMMTLTMQSGLGMAIPMDQNFMLMMQQMMSAVGAAATDPVMPPMNPSLLAVIYAGGDPHYVTAPNQNDFATLKWLGGPPVLTTEATAFTMAKDVEWAKLFHRNEHFGQARVDTFGSTQRFVGMVLAAMVKMQLQAYLAGQANYHTSNAGDYALLFALSDGAGFYSAPDQANNQGPNAVPPRYPAENRYTDPNAAAQFASLARLQFQKVLRSHPSTPRELSLAIQSVVWYASVATNAGDLGQAKGAILAWANRLFAGGGAEDEVESPAALAYRVRGLIEAGRTTGLTRFLDQAATAFNQLIQRFDYLHGVLRGSETLTTGDVGEIAGAFNAANLWLGNRIDQAAPTNVFGAWWEGTVNLSGLEISSPAVNQMKGAYELLNPPGRGVIPQNVLNYRYRTVPFPENAGGAHGVAPVFAAAIRWDDDRRTWQANAHWFDTAGAMQAANEMIWFHSDEINGFPAVTLP